MHNRYNSQWIFADYLTYIGLLIDKIGPTDQILHSSSRGGSTGQGIQKLKDKNVSLPLPLTTLALTVTHSHTILPAHTAAAIFIQSSDN